jgi:DNA-binding XRE family transcriptional regulator
MSYRIAVALSTGSRYFVDRFQPIPEGFPMIDHKNTRHGQAIRALRMRCIPPMRQGELRERLGVSPTTMSAIERGEIRCSVAMARAISLQIADRSDVPAWRAAVSIVMGEPVP